MKDKIIYLINTKINEVMRERERARRENDLVRIGINHKVIQVLQDLIKSIQSQI